MDQTTPANTNQDSGKNTSTFPIKGECSHCGGTVQVIVSQREIRSLSGRVLAASRIRPSGNKTNHPRTRRTAPTGPTRPI
jgi:hypothetical protein